MKITKVSPLVEWINWLYQTTDYGLLLNIKKEQATGIGKNMKRSQMPYAKWKKVRHTRLTYSMIIMGHHPGKSETIGRN